MINKILRLKRGIVAGIDEAVQVIQTQGIHLDSPKTRVLFSDEVLTELQKRYEDYSNPKLGYAKVQDFCDSFDQMRPFAELNGDLKDVQRPWTLKTLIALLPKSSRVLEIGAGEPWVADCLSRMGHEVWVCDPYDGTGNGPLEFDRYSRECPAINFVKTFFNENALTVSQGYFDAIYSISVLEHVPLDGQKEVFKGIEKYLKPTGYSIHSVDHILRGKGAEEHLDGLRRINKFSGHTDDELDHILHQLSDDIETYYLSAESHNRWRGGVPYDQFPMRVCVSIHFCTPYAQINSKT